MIRKARIRDLQQIHEIECLAFGKSAFSRRALSYHISNNLVICVDVDDVIAGYMCFSPLTKTKKRRIYSIAVHPSHRKKGHAKSLMTNGERLSRAKQIHLEVDETNHGAIKLYESLGYVVFGRYEKYYGRTDALRMRKLT